MAATAIHPSADELTLAYRKAGLRRIGVSYATAIMTPATRTALLLMVQVARKAALPGQSSPVRPTSAQQVAR